jgi:acyl-coenzyme A thioesterase PaaI-like protein
MALRETFFLRAFGFFKIPLLFFLRPSVVELSGERCVVRIPLGRRSRNHLGSMYFGALAAGADCAGGLMAMRMIRDGGGRVSLVFKDFQAEFLKRPESDVLFTCDQGLEIAELVRKATDSEERQNLPVRITATCPDKLGDEPVAKFTLTLSLKKRA